MVMSSSLMLFFKIAGFYYGVGFVVWVVFFTVGWAYGGGRDDARLVLATPLWPVVLAYWGIRLFARVVRDAVRVDDVAETVSYDEAELGSWHRIGLNMSLVGLRCTMSLDCRHYCVAYRRVNQLETEASCIDHLTEEIRACLGSSYRSRG